MSLKPSAPDPVTGYRSRLLSCDQCGRSVDTRFPDGSIKPWACEGTVPIGWSQAYSDGRARHVCPSCRRENQSHDFLTPKGMGCGPVCARCGADAQDRGPCPGREE